MFNKLIYWSLKNPILVIILGLVLLSAGIVAVFNMPFDVFPDLTAPTVTILTEGRGMAPVEMENQVTFPIEAALNGVPGVRRVRSASSIGISIVWAEFDWGTDIYLARQIVSEKISLVSAVLPSEVDRPVLAPISSIMGEILFISLTSDQHSPLDVRTYADTQLRRRLLSVPGVSQVTPIGGGVKQYQVIMDMSRMRELAITIEEVTRALGESNRNVTAGFIDKGPVEFMVQGEGRFVGIEDIAATVIREHESIPVRLSDVADVRIGEAPRRGDGSVNGKPAVIIGIQKQPDVNTLELTRRLEVIFDEIEAALPQGMVLNRELFRQADFIEVAIENILEALRDGSILVVLIVLLFLANLRATAITLTAIPLSLVTTVIILQSLGASINTMTLGGIAIAIGALVDDAVIDVENVYRRLRENMRLPLGERRPTLDVVYRASVEIRSSIVFATFIIVLVFIPIFFLSGVEGRLLFPLGMAYIIAIIASLIVAMTLTPVLCSLVFPRSKTLQRGYEPPLSHLLKGAYSATLDFVLRRPWMVIAPSLVLLAVTLILTQFWGFTFLPEFNEGALSISAVTLPGTNLEQANEYGLMIESILLKQPEVVSVARRQGRAELDEHAQGVESSEIDVSYELKDRGKAEFLEALRAELAFLPGMNITVGQPISHRIDHMLSGTRASIAIKIFGPDLTVLRQLAEETKQGIAGVEGVVDLSIDQQMNIPTIRVRFDRQKLARFGLRPEAAADTLQAALSGVPATRVLEGANSFDVVVKLADSAPLSDETLGELIMINPDGEVVPLSEVAAIVKDFGPNRVGREELERKMVVSCNVADRGVASVVDDIRAIVDPVVGARDGYRVEYGGQFESAVTAGQVLGLLGMLVIVGIAFLLFLAFRSWRDALLTMSNLPLALIGGVFGVFLSGGVLSIASIIGFITVFGIATRNGIMMVSHIKHVQEHEGVTDFRAAVYKGASERLIPILMTALATGLALVPLALRGGQPGSEIETPMAFVILFGLITSMLLNMIIVPALYILFGKPTPAKVQQ